MQFVETFETTMEQDVDFGKTGSKKYDDVTSVRETKKRDNTSIISSFKECSGFSIESCFLKKNQSIISLSTVRDAHSIDFDEWKDCS